MRVNSLESNKNSYALSCLLVLMANFSGILLKLVPLKKFTAQQLDFIGKKTNLE